MGPGSRQDSREAASGFAILCAQFIQQELEPDRKRRLLGERVHAQALANGLGDSLASFRIDRSRTFSDSVGHSLKIHFPHGTIIKSRCGKLFPRYAHLRIETSIKKPLAPEEPSVVVDKV
jgi:hypothetical protein